MFESLKNIFGGSEPVKEKNEQTPKYSKGFLVSCINKIAPGIEVSEDDVLELIESAGLTDNEVEDMTCAATNSQLTSESGKFLPYSSIGTYIDAIRARLQTVGKEKEI